jgi:hypothetical protein
MEPEGKLSVQDHVGKTNLGYKGLTGSNNLDLMKNIGVFKYPGISCNLDKLYLF